jgi:hypothetical protein
VRLAELLLPKGEQSKKQSRLGLCLALVVAGTIPECGPDSFLFAFNKVDLAGSSRVRKAGRFYPNHTTSLRQWKASA